MDMDGALALAAILFIAAATGVYSMIRAAYSFAPWIPSSRKLAQKALEYIRPAPGVRFIDLGCGDGRIVSMASRDFQLDAHGVENSFIPFLCAKARRIVLRERGMSIEFKNLFDVPLAHFDIVYLYGLPQPLNERLVPKLESEVKPGTYVLSYNFSLRGKIPLASFRDRWRNLFVYRF